MPDQPYVDPPDLQFGKAAKEKADTLDALLDSGESPEEIVEVEEEVGERGQATVPRAGNKAPVAGDRDAP
jgi:hypothetical protein